MTSKTADDAKINYDFRNIFDNIDNMTFEDFLALISSKIQKTEPFEEIIRCLSYFDKERKGLIEYHFFINILSQLMPNLERTYTDHLLSLIPNRPTSDSPVNYVSFVELLLLK